MDGAVQAGATTIRQAGGIITEASGVSLPYTTNCSHTPVETLLLRRSAPGMCASGIARAGMLSWALGAEKAEPS